MRQEDLLSTSASESTSEPSSDDRGGRMQHSAGVGSWLR